MHKLDLKYFTSFSLENWGGCAVFASIVGWVILMMGVIKKSEKRMQFRGVGSV